MKKILSVLLAVVFIAGFVSFVPLLDMNAHAALGTSYNLTGTRSGNNPTTSLTTNSIAKGSTFTVKFDNTSFAWSPALLFPANDIRMQALNDQWIRFITPDNAFTYIWTADPADGSVTFTVTATQTGTHSLSLSMLGGTNGAETKIFARNLVITENIASITGTADGTAPSNDNGSPKAINTGDTLLFTFPADNFVWDPADGVKNASSLTDTSWIRLGGATLGTDFHAAFDTPAGNSGLVRVRLTALRSGTWNNLQVYLQSPDGMRTKATPSMQVTVNSPSAETKIIGIASGAQLGGGGAYLNGRYISSNELGNLDVQRGDELLIPVTAGLFDWQGTAPNPSTAVTKSQLNAGKVRIEVSGINGRKAFENTKPDFYQKNGWVYVRVQFADNLMLTQDLDFSMDIYLTADGSYNNSSLLYLSGVFTQNTIDVYDDEAYIDLSYGGVIEPENYIRNAEIYLGEGVTLLTSLSSGRKYTGFVSLTLSSGDEDFMAKYPDLDYILTLNTRNFNTASTKVTLDYDFNYYVYDQDLEYIGRSNSKNFPWSDRYYLAVREIDFSDEKFEEPDYDEPPYAGDDVRIPLANPNDNPGTGR